jgi:hypothetical protein
LVNGEGVIIRPHRGATPPLFHASQPKGTERAVVSSGNVEAVGVYPGPEWRPHSPKHVVTWDVALTGSPMVEVVARRLDVHVE